MGFQLPSLPQLVSGSQISEPSTDSSHGSLPKSTILTPRDLDQQLFRRSLLHYLPRIKDEDLLEPRGVSRHHSLKWKTQNCPTCSPAKKNTKTLPKKVQWLKNLQKCSERHGFLLMNFIDLCFVTLELYTLNNIRPFFHDRNPSSQGWPKSGEIFIQSNPYPKPKAIRFQIQESNLVV